MGMHVTGFYQSSKSFWSCTRVNSCSKIYTTYQSTCFIDYFIQGIIKNPRIKEIEQVHQKLQVKQFYFFVSFVFYVVLHLNMKQFRFTGEPMTQQTCQSYANVNHVRT